MAQTRGQRLKVAMQARGLVKLSAMAAAAGVTESAISRWCHEGPMTIKNAVNVCEVLEISLDWLVLGRGSMEQTHQSTGQFYPQISSAIARMKPEVREHLSQFLSGIQR